MHVCLKGMKGNNVLWWVRDPNRSLSLLHSYMVTLLLLWNLGKSTYATVTSLAYISKKQLHRELQITAYTSTELLYLYSLFLQGYFVAALRQGAECFCGDSGLRRLWWMQQLLLELHWGCKHDVWREGSIWCLQYVRWAWLEIHKDHAGETFLWKGLHLFQIFKMIIEVKCKNVLNNRTIAIESWQ